MLKMLIGPISELAGTFLKNKAAEKQAVVLSLPLIGAFIPSMVPYVQEGFNVLSTMPDYYKAFLGGAIAASFGIKSMSSWSKK